MALILGEVPLEYTSRFALYLDSEVYFHFTSTSHNKPKPNQFNCMKKRMKTNRCAQKTENGGLRNSVYRDCLQSTAAVFTRLID
jgi:hypothetical protein